MVALGFSIEGPSEAQIDAQDNKDGSCRAKYFPTVPGDYIIHITCNNQDIKDSPFNAKILPADAETTPIDPGQIMVSGPGIAPTGNAINKSTTIIIMFPQNTPMGMMPKVDVLIVDRDGDIVPASPAQPLGKLKLIHRGTETFYRNLTLLFSNL